MHVVGTGETFALIGAHRDVSARDILETNNLRDPNKI
jgi:hypothetical protein